MRAKTKGLPAERVLRAALAWRDARREVFGCMSNYKKMDQYTEACDALERAVSAFSPLRFEVIEPDSFEVTLRKSVQDARQKLVRRG